MGAEFPMEKPLLRRSGCLEDPCSWPLTSMIPGLPLPVPHDDHDLGNWAEVEIAQVALADEEHSVECNVAEGACTLYGISSDLQFELWQNGSLSQKGAKCPSFLVAEVESSGSFVTTELSPAGSSCTPESRDIPWTGEICAYLGGEGGVEYWLRTPWGLKTTEEFEGTWFGRLTGALDEGTFYAGGLSFNSVLVREEPDIRMTSSFEFEGREVALVEGSSGSCSWPELAG